MAANMIIVSGEAYVANNMSKITEGYTSEKYSILELIQKLFDFGKFEGLDLGTDLYTVIEKYITEKLDEYTELKNLDLYKDSDTIEELYDLILDIIPRDILYGDNIYNLFSIYYTLDDKIYQFKSALNDKETLLELAENYESITALKR